MQNVEQKKIVKTSRQQQEALAFFDRTADDWDAKARGDVPQEVNVIEQRNQYVLHVIDGREVTQAALDVGCGVGALTLAMAERGISAVGIDFAQGMVDIAHKRLVESKSQMAEFICNDFFDYHVEPETFDVIAANGFIEYVSFEQRDDFLRDSFRGMQAGGSLVVSSRNRLFNLFSANSFTQRELRDDAIEALLLELMALAGDDSIDKLMELTAAPFPDQEIEHTDTGIGVATRYQYTPVQLMQLAGQAGFEIVSVSPIHVHGVLPAFKQERPDVHTRIANVLQEVAVDKRIFLPQASAFMLHARKPIG